MLPESAVISEYLNERYPEQPLWPVDPGERAAGRLLVFRFDDFSGPYYALRREEAGSTGAVRRGARLPRRAARGHAARLPGGSSASRTSPISRGSCARATCSGSRSSRGRCSSRGWSARPGGRRWPPRSSSSRRYDRRLPARSAAGRADVGARTKPGSSLGAAALRPRRHDGRLGRGRAPVVLRAGPLLVGASMGGYCAVAAARLAPERVAGIVLAGSRPDPDSPGAAGEARGDDRNRTRPRRPGDLGGDARPPLQRKCTDPDLVASPRRRWRSTAPRTSS